MIYLDHGATSWPKAPGVTEAMVRYLEHESGNPGRGGHRLGDDVDLAHAGVLGEASEPAAVVGHEQAQPDDVALGWHTGRCIVRDGAEGLTVVYRESPAALDEAMPLNIFTSMFWYVKLSRCGLVLNRNIPIGKVPEIDLALKRFSNARYNKTSDADLQKMKESLRSNRFLTMGMTRYRYGRKDATGWRGDSKEFVKRVEELFDGGEDDVEKSSQIDP